MSTPQALQLSPENSFSIQSDCQAFYSPSSIEQLTSIAPLLDEPFYVLGAGTNTLFVDESTPTIIHPDFHGINANDCGDHVLVTGQCAENWHQFVQFCLANGYYGIENLALIPGSIGAAPVQNIGAYGVELADVLDSVTWYEFSAQTLHRFSNSECQFGYRDSIFKRELFGKGLIVSVTLKLTKYWQPTLSYQGLAELGEQATPEQVFQQVVDLRRSKLPDPEQLANAGSFFKNPVVDQDKFSHLQQNYPDMPFYPQPTGKYKLAAGWLIDQCGLKGFRQGKVGVHQHQALVLVNYGQASGQDIYRLAQHVQQLVRQKFAISLEPEVRLLTSHGLIELAEIKN